jgi:uncharacterized OB-fold protein
VTDSQDETFGDPTTAPFWEAAESHRLVVQRCRDCGHHQFYPRPFCLACESKAVGWHEVSGRGTVYSMSEVHMAPAPEIETPYVIAIVELDEGPKFMTNIVNGPCEIGSKVRVAWRDREGKPPVADFEPVRDGD